NRQRRYETANGFARDIQRYLAAEPVEACAPSAGYRLRKFVQRNRGKVLAASLVVLALLAGIAGTTAGFIRPEQQRPLAEANENKATGAAVGERQAREREAEQRAKAEKARDRTRQALDAMTSSITGDSLASQHELSSDQKKFLTEVLTYYQEFAGERLDDETSRARTAAAAYRVGMIETCLGRREEAVAAFKTARDGYVKLMMDYPTVPAYRFELSRNQNNVASIIDELGKPSQAEEEHRNSLANLEKLVADFPSVPDYKK